MSTISGTVTHGVTLGSAGYTSPLTITAEGLIAPSTGPAIQASATYAGADVINYGSIAATGTSAAIILKDGGSIDNSGTAALIAGYRGITISGAAGTVTNGGTIAVTEPSTAKAVGAVGIFLGAGGAIYNSGLIEGSGSFANLVEVKGAAGTVDNTGTILWTSTVGYAVALYAGGTLNNNALIQGRGGGGVMATSGGAIVNSGTILGGSATLSTVLFIGDGSLDNTGLIQAGYSGLAAADSYVNNQGTILGTTHLYGDGVDLRGLGPVTLNNSGYISGYYGVAATAGLSGTNETINSGTIVGNHRAGVLSDGGIVSNVGSAALIQGVRNGVASYGAISGIVVNQGTIASTGNGTAAGVAFVVSTASINNSGLIEGSYGLRLLYGATVSNSGTIVGTAHHNGAVVIQRAGSVDNSGLISGQGAGGVYIAHIYPGLGTVTNSGTIIGTGPSDTLDHGDGVLLGDGGTVVNTGASALISGYTSIYVADTASTPGFVVNTGTVVATATGPLGIGIDLAAGGTITDAGAIIGGSGIAVEFGGTGSNLLVLEHGYSVSGEVAGSADANNTLELAGSVGAALTVNYNDLALSNFEDVLFGPGGRDTVDVSNSSGSLPVTISGFTRTSDVVDLTAIGTDGSITSQSATSVTISGSLGAVTLQLDATDGAVFATSSDGANGTDVSIACFLRGTMILTPAGEVAVEVLAIGDLVTTALGEARPIKWVGRRSYAARFALGQKHILPVCIKTGALANGVPKRDLRLSPNHALYLEGVLIEARDLINGASIVQPEASEAIEYFHIELDSHDVLIANGTPAESYIDDDNRLLFHNAAQYRTLYPRQSMRPARYCAPRPAEGEAVERARVAIARRAGLPVTTEERRQRRGRR